MSKPSIRVRLALAHTMTFGSLLTLWAIVFYWMAYARVYAQMDEQLVLRYETLRAAMRIAGGKLAWLYDKGDAEQFYIAARAGFYFQLFDHQGVFLDGSELAKVVAFPFTDAARKSVERRTPSWETFVLRERHKFRVINSWLLSPDGKEYLLRVGMRAEETDETLRQLAIVLGLLVPLMVLIGATTGWWVAGRALGPVGEISAAAKRITSSSLAERLPLQGTQDELDQLSATLNEMIERLQQSFEQMNQFITNVSHELRTPLAALRGTAEVALRTAKTEADYRKALAGSVEELERLAGTVSDLLELARAEAGQLSLRRERENLAELARDAVESIRVLASERQIAVHFEANGDVVAEVDPEHVLRLLTNLLDNAIKYNHSGGRIDVSVGAADAGALITIFNTGKGIALEDQPHIFDRFFRGRGNESVEGGAGLGLSLVRWIVAAHNGRVEVECPAGGGATFRVWLPQS